MADMAEVQSKQGLDLASLGSSHPHARHRPERPVGGPDPWAEFLHAIAASNPPIRAIGITDYFGIERYEQVVDEKRRGRCLA